MERELVGSMESRFATTFAAIERDRGSFRRRTGDEDNETAYDPRRKRCQSEGRGAGASFALHLVYAALDERSDRHRRPAIQGGRRKLDGSRVLHPPARGKSERMGLVQSATRRWIGDHAVRAAPEGWHDRSLFGGDVRRSARTLDAPFGEGFFA